MIKAVFFDFYNTLVRFEPPVEEIQEQACRELGLKVDRGGVRRGYAQANSYWAQEQGGSVLARKGQGGQEAFYAEYERLILRGAGLEVAPELALKIFQRAGSIPRRLTLYEDVLPTVQELKARGLKLGLISNIPQEWRERMKGLGLLDQLDLLVTPQEAGAEKPDAAIFRYALERAGVQPGEALMVGDQYEVDVQGAQRVGMMGLLLDREDAFPSAPCPRIRSLEEVPGFIARS